jgi:hypothetical protein
VANLDEALAEIDASAAHGSLREIRGYRPATLAVTFCSCACIRESYWMKSRAGEIEPHFCDLIINRPVSVISIGL